MKKYAPLIFTVLCSAASLNAADTHDFFVRPFAMHLDYTNDGFSSEEGYGLTAGAFLDTNHAHELALEFGHSDWEFSKPLPGGFSNTPFKTTGEGDTTLIHANYRYNLFAPTTRIRPYIGGSIGTAKLSGEIERKLSGPWYVGETDEWTFSFAACAGASLRITDHFSIELGYRYLQIQGSDIQTHHHGSNQPGVIIPMEDLNAHILTAGVTIHF